MKCMPEGRFLLINARHYPTNEQLFAVVRAAKKLQAFSHILFKHGLQFYPFMRDSLSGFSVVFV